MPSSQLRMPFLHLPTISTETDNSKVTHCNLQPRDSLTKTPTSSLTNLILRPSSLTSSHPRNQAKWGNQTPLPGPMYWDKMNKLWREAMETSITRSLQERRENGKVQFSKVLLRTFQWGNGSSRKALERADFTETLKDQALGKRKNTLLPSWARKKRLDLQSSTKLMLKWEKLEKYTVKITNHKKRNYSLKRK